MKYFPEERAYVNFCVRQKKKGEVGSNVHHGMTAKKITENAAKFLVKWIMVKI